MPHSRCLLCAHDAFLDVSPPGLVGVTSDCKPWPRAGELRLCRRCGHVQKALTPQWLRDVAEIYAGYELYPLSALSEQMIRVGDGFVSRNGHLADRLAGVHPIPETGDILDIGCGNGGFLRAFSKRFPGWRLFGCEQQADRRQDILGLPAAGGFYQGDIEAIDRRFDAISLVYVIEHLFDPAAVLRAIRQKLAPGGFVFVKTADLRTGPFDLAVADHCHHFTLEMLACLLGRTGFAVTRAFDDWVDKEIGLVAVAADQPAPGPMPPVPLAEVEAVVRANLGIMAAIRDKAAASAVRPLGILGTAMSATWLANQLGPGAASFFVDEDTSRVGRTHMDRPVLSLDQAPAGCAVCVPFPPPVAARIVSRVGQTRPDITFLA